MECRLEEGLSVVQHDVGSQQVFHNVQNNWVCCMVHEKRNVPVRVANLVDECLPLGALSPARFFRPRLPANQLRGILQLTARNGIDGVSNLLYSALIQKRPEAQIALTTEKALLFRGQSFHAETPRWMYSQRAQAPLH